MSTRVPLNCPSLRPRDSRVQGGDVRGRDGRPLCPPAAACNRHAHAHAQIGALQLAAVGRRSRRERAPSGPNVATLEAEDSEPCSPPAEAKQEASQY